MGQPRGLEWMWALKVDHGFKVIVVSLGKTLSPSDPVYLVWTMGVL